MIIKGDEIIKKFFGLVSILLVAFLLVGCGKTETKSKNIEGSLDEIITKLYEGIDEEKMPMMVESNPLTDDNFESFAFTNAKYKEAIVSESMTGSTPHSVVLIRLQDESYVDAVVKEIKENADPRKWICVEAENVYVLNKGDLVVLIMSNELADHIKANFENLK